MAFPLCFVVVLAAAAAADNYTTVEYQVRPLRHGVFMNLDQKLTTCFSFKYHESSTVYLQTYQSWLQKCLGNPLLKELKSGEG